MKTSWNEMQLIEKFLLQTASGEEQALFSMRLILEPELRMNTRWQQAAYAVIDEYGRQKLRKEVEEVAEDLFTAGKYQTFRQSILNIFKK